MARSTEIRVNPGLLRWARESSGEEVDRVAKRLQVKPELVEKWEAGEKLVTYRRLETLADIYKRPVAAFFLASVPDEPEGPTDFRSTNRGPVKTQKDLKLSIRRARYLRNAYAEMNPDYVRFTHSQVTLSTNVETLAAAERERMGFTFDMQRRWAVGSDAYNNWKKLLEDMGVLVFQAGFATSELSGFSLGDTDKPPVIVVNSRDAINRKTFTLFHEYCHILLRSTGVCKLKPTPQELQRDNSVEAYCDRFAAAFLVPKTLFLEHPAIESITNRIEDERAIKNLANAFKVSRQVILIQLLLNNKIDRSYYDEKKRKFEAEFDAAQEKKKQKQKESKSGPPRHLLAVSENGKLFTRAALRAYRDGRISKRDVSSYLGVKLGHLPAVESML